MKHNVCPWYLGWFLASPIRTLMYNPAKIAAPYLKQGMTALDIGPGMGFFTLPMAKLVGPDGLVIAADIQPQMLKGLEKRARAKQLSDRIQTQLCSPESLNLTTYNGSIDFALLFAVVHELPDQQIAFREVCSALKPGGLVLFAEPDRHVSKETFDHSVTVAVAAGFTVKEYIPIRASHAALLQARL
ncbi:MAG: class I SAM-dependent methyltransferase [Lachnospiraceae bacterium]